MCFQQTRRRAQREAIFVFELKVNEPDAKCEQRNIVGN